MGFPVLTTERLVLEPLAVRHSAGMFALWSNAEVCRYAGEAHDLAGAPIPLPAASPADSDRILAFFVERARAGTGVRWAVLTRDENAFVGAIGFNALAEPAELAYHLCAERWGEGFASEACAAVVAWLRSERGIAAVEAYVEPENAPSIALAERLGFVPLEEWREGARRFVLPPT